jgi:acylphosphatase
MGRLHLTLYGAVQGVGFRYFAQRAARAAGVTAGWVRNRPDGAVELEAEADPATLAAFRERVSRGPAHARVDRVTEEQPGGDQLPSPFSIMR